MKKDAAAERGGEGDALVVEHVAVTELTPHPRNYKTHPPDQLQHIARSLEQYGFYRNVVVARNNVILAGHGVVQAALRLGMTNVPVVRLDLDPHEPSALKLVAADNEIGKMAHVDDRALSELLKEVAGAGDLLGTGFDERALANLVYVTRSEGEVQSFDAAAEWVGMPDFDPGDQRQRLVVQFRNEEDRATFVERIKLDVVRRQGQTWSTWWPSRAQSDDLHSLRWEEDVDEQK